MPIYAYRCRECGATEEHIQKISDPPMRECSSCKGALEKQISRAAFHLKGGGWYADGYASSGSKDSGAASTSKSEGSSSGSTKSDSGASSGGESSKSGGGSSAASDS